MERGDTKSQNEMCNSLPLLSVGKAERCPQAFSFLMLFRSTFKELQRDFYCRNVGNHFRKVQFLVKEVWHLKHPIQ